MYKVLFTIFILDNVSGVGPAPIGWSEDISWEDFSGTTRSKLTVEQITRIITSMLTTDGIDPAQHVIGADVPLEPVEEVNHHKDFNTNQRNVNSPTDSNSIVNVLSLISFLYYIIYKNMNVFN